MAGFTDNDIRPHVFDEEKDREIRNDIAWLTARKDAFVDVDCPACGATERTVAFEKFGFAFQSCADCGTAYMAPRATPELMAEFYARSTLYAFWDRCIFPASRRTRMENIFRPRAERIGALCREAGLTGGRLVDVGASVGMFCEEAARTGTFDTLVAVEPNAAQARTCRGLGLAGLSVIEGDFLRPEVAALCGPATVVSCFEVIEHLFSPAMFLERCREVLVPGGLVALTCPNLQGFDIAELGTASDSIDCEHVNLFTPASLARLAGRCGFSVLEWDTPGRLDAEIVRAKVLAGEATLDSPTLRTILIDRWDEVGAAFQDFLAANGLSSHLWMVLRKEG